MNPRDRRSVGEILLAADLDVRRLLLDVQGQDGPPMLRTWGEVVQAAAELWQVLPVPVENPGHRDTAAMTRLESVARGMHRAQLRAGWPGDGPTDERLLGVAEAFTRAAALIERYYRPTRPARPEVRADIDAARMRIMHTLYVGAHGVGLSLRAHVRDLRVALIGVRNSQQTRGIPRGLEAASRMAAFEQLAGGYVRSRYAQAVRGEVVPAPDGLRRLQEALVAWDIQAHRTLASEPTPANVTSAARTQAAVTMATAALLASAAATRKIRPDAYRRLSLALESTQAAWTLVAGHWSELVAPTTPRTDPDLITVGGELRAALLEITHDRTALARPEVMAGRVDLGAAAGVVQQALTAAVDVACEVRGVAEHDQRLTGPARVLARRATAGLDAQVDTPPRTSPPVDDLAAAVSAADVHANRMLPLPASIRAALIDAGNVAVHAAAGAMSAAACLDPTPTALVGRGARTPSSAGRDAADRLAPPVVPPALGPSCAR